MSKEAELINIAGDLKRLADRLLDCCKEKESKKEESVQEKEESGEKPVKPHLGMIAMLIKKKMGK